MKRRERWHGQHHVGLEDNPTWSIVIYLRPPLSSCLLITILSFYQNPYLLRLLIPYNVIQSALFTIPCAEPRIGFRPSANPLSLFLLRFAKLGKWWAGTRNPRQKRSGKWWTSMSCPESCLQRRTYHRGRYEFHMKQNNWSRISTWFFLKSYFNMNFKLQQHDSPWIWQEKEDFL